MPGLNLAEINNLIATKMQTSEDEVRNMLSSLGDGSTASVTDLVGLQFNMSVYTITAQTVGAIMKESSDTMKSIVQKI